MIIKSKVVNGIALHFVTDSTAHNKFSDSGKYKRQVNQKINESLDELVKLIDEIDGIE